MIKREKNHKRSEADRRHRSAFDPRIEEKWQEVWEREGVYRPNLDKAKKPFYNLMMFPYPSAEGLHVGNMYAFTGADVYGRFKRMQGYSVFEPIGLDGFGIHSENYAIKVGRHPKEQAKISESNFYRQLRATGNGYDWSRTVETYDPDYYKWTQWIFIQLFKAGLAYRKKAAVNFCPKDLTVLADEQVIDGKCERCGSIVEKRDLDQWFFRITDYADRLLDGLSKIDWTEKVKIAQRQWIGKSQGTVIHFPIASDAKDKQCLIIHGISGNSGENWFPWLKKELEGENWEVALPDLPNSDHPDVSSWNEVLKSSTKDFSEDSVIVAHSLGVPAALNLIQSTGKKFRKLILVAPVNSKQDWHKLKKDSPDIDWEAVKKFAEIDFDWDKIKKHVDDIVVYYSDTDPYIPASSVDFYKKHLAKAKFIEQKGKGHFNSSSGATKLPELFNDLIDKIAVFTTRGDTLYGATFLVLAPEHDVVQKLLHGKFSLVRSDLARLDEVRVYVEKAKKRSEIERKEDEKEKTGVFTGLYGINPLNNEKIPIWIADYALMGFGTGALFGDAHDERDCAFAKKYDIPLKVTVITGDKEKDARILNKEEVFTGFGKLIDSGEFTGLTSEEAMKKVTQWLEKHAKGEAKTTYHLRDWLISRQRYWGAPIPMIHCDKCDWQPVPDEDLPVLLPEVKDWKPKGTGKSPLASIENFVNTTCPNCGGEAVRETDVSDTFLDSSWYFFRYISTEFNDKPFDKLRVKRWLPVNMYIGGAEHSVLHLLYTRFLTMVFHDLKLTSFEEPFPKFYAHGLLIKEGAKMSKSKGNVVIPDEYIKKYGADTLRTYLMFLGPFSQGGDFYDSSIAGIHRFLQRVYALAMDHVNAGITNRIIKVKKVSQQTDHNSAKDGLGTPDSIVDKKLHQTIKKITADMENLRLNTAIAALMELLNVYNDNKEYLRLTHLEQFLLMLAPFSPHIAEELWQKVIKETKETQEPKGKNPPVSVNLAPSGSSATFQSIHVHQWPIYDPRMLEEDEVTIVVQINGKVRDSIKYHVSGIKYKDKIEQMVKEREKVTKYLEGKDIKKVIYVEGKILNFVTD